MFGLPAASTNTSTSAPPDHGTAWLSGATPLIVVPSGRQTSPSAWNPGLDWENPRSITSSTAVPSSGQPSGSRPVTWNQVVLHGAPHARPGATDAKSWPTASANGTGSPGAVHAASS